MSRTERTNALCKVRPMSHLEVERWSRLRVWRYARRNRGGQRNQAALQQLDLQPGETFLDIGSGLGEALEEGAARGAAVYGVDPSPEMVRKASRRVKAATVKVGSAEAIPYPDNAFDAVMCVASFHHWVDRERGFAEVARVIRPGGRLLIVEKLLDQGPDHGLSRSEAEEVSERLIGVGFEASEISTLAWDPANLIVIKAMFRGD